MVRDGFLYQERVKWVRSDIKIIHEGKLLAPHKEGFLFRFVH